MPLPNYTAIGDWARFALTGDPSSPAPTDAVLQFVVGGVVAQFLASNPCVSDGAGGYGTLDAADKAAVEESLGGLVAARFLSTPAGIRFAGDTQQIKIGPITKTRKAIEVSELKASCLAAARAARVRVSCIRQGLTNTGLDALADLSGHRRNIGEPCTVQGIALGAGADYD